MHTHTQDLSHMNSVRVCVCVCVCLFVCLFVYSEAHSTGCNWLCESDTSLLRLVIRLTGKLERTVV